MVLLDVGIVAFAAEHLVCAHLAHERELETGCLIGWLHHVEVKDYLILFPIVTEVVFEVEPGSVKCEEAIAVLPLNRFVL